MTFGFFFRDCCNVRKNTERICSCLLRQVDLARDPNSPNRRSRLSFALSLSFATPGLKNRS